VTHSATDWESMYSEAVSRPNQKDESISSESGRLDLNSVSSRGILGIAALVTTFMIYKTVA